MEMEPQRYEKLVKAHAPATKCAKNCLFAFLGGGSICTLAQLLRELFLLVVGLNEETTATTVSVILIFAAILLTGIFIVVDRKSKQKEETIKAGEAKTLFAIDPTISTRLILENEEGTFTFVVNPETDMWELEGDDQFNLNVYAVAAINNYFCTLSSEKTVAFDCKDTSVYGFSHPVTLKLSFACLPSLAP